MIKQMSLAELARFQKNFYYKNHQHQEERVFVGVEMESVRAYELCKLCGQMKPLVLDEEMTAEIKEILDKKGSS